MIFNLMTVEQEYNPFLTFDINKIIMPELIPYHQQINNGAAKII